MTLGRADLLEGTQTDSEIDTEDRDSSDIADKTYSEPWNAVKTYQWLQGILYFHFHRDNGNVKLQQLWTEVGERPSTAKRLQKEDEEIENLEIPPAPDAPVMVTPYGDKPTQSQLSSMGILQLPPEILSEIFFFAGLHNAHMPYIMSQINTYFRDVAFSTPQLWTDINVLAPSTVTLVYLEKSKPLPITVDVTMTDGYPFVGEEGIVHLERFMNMVTPHSVRIRELTLIFTVWHHLILPLRHMQYVAFPSLESLDFGLTNIAQPSNYAAQAQDVVQAWCAKPTSRLDITGIHFPGLWKGAPPISAVLATLKVKECRNLLLADFLDILSSLPRLEHLTLEDCHFVDSGRCNEVRSTGTLIRLPKLAVVEMHWVWPFIDILSPASPVSAPKLTSISASFTSTTRTSGMPPWLVELSQAHPQLSNLDITGCVVKTDVWAAAFRNWNSLTSLRLMWCDLDDSDLRILSPPVIEDSQPTLLPKLQKLTLDNELSLSSKVISDIVRGRYALARAKQVGSAARHVVGLQEVTLRGWDAGRVSHDDVADIVECVERFNIGTLQSGISDILDEGSDSDAEWPSDSDSDETIN
ncbi:hypothetical protein FS837_012214 [Tulasnella sp. UAMH 9824]|nr:hypothetical protein FS837_012214 [Tulasnella sp. UAMH 9824]